MCPPCLGGRGGFLFGSIVCGFLKDEEEEEEEEPPVKKSRTPVRTPVSRPTPKTQTRPPPKPAVSYFIFLLIR